jgi:hypothetical protein
MGLQKGGIQRWYALALDNDRYADSYCASCLELGWQSFAMKLGFLQVRGQVGQEEVEVEHRFDQSGLGERG